MKKMITFVFLFALLFSVNTFADEGFAIGVAGTFGVTNFLEQTGGLPGFIVLFKLPSIPVMFGGGARIGENDTIIFIKADWWMVSEQLVDMLYIYAGPGVFCLISQSVDIGLRIPVGFRIFPIDIFEIYVEPALTIGIGNIGGDPMDIPTVGFQGELGIRFWF